MILTPFLMDLGKVVHGMRPDWPLPNIHRALCDCGERSEAEIALAAVRVAADPGSRSPTRITLTGVWWQPPDLTDAKPAADGARQPPYYVREEIRAIPPTPTFLAARAQLPRRTPQTATTEESDDA